MPGAKSWGVPKILWRSWCLTQSQLIGYAVSYVFVHAADHVGPCEKSTPPELFRHSIGFVPVTKKLHKGLKKFLKMLAKDYKQKTGRTNAQNSACRGKATHECRNLSERLSPVKWCSYQWRRTPCALRQGVCLEHRLWKTLQCDKVVIAFPPLAGLSQCLSTETLMASKWGVHHQEPDSVPCQNQWGCTYQGDNAAFIITH